MVGALLTLWSVGAQLCKTAYVLLLEILQATIYQELENWVTIVILHIKKAEFDLLD